MSGNPWVKGICGWYKWIKIDSYSHVDRSLVATYLMLLKSCCSMLAGEAWLEFGVSIHRSEKELRGKQWRQLNQSLLGDKAETTCNLDAGQNHGSLTQFMENHFSFSLTWFFHQGFSGWKLFMTPMLKIQDVSRSLILMLMHFCWLHLLVSRRGMAQGRTIHRVAPWKRVY